MKKRKFFIQWDSTNDCNLRCEHCYHNREGHSDHKQDSNLMSFKDVKNMIDDLNNTSEKWGFKPRFQISGGEPILRKDLKEILDYTKYLNVETRLLTNGTLITFDKAKELRKRGIKRLQISIDGNKEHHNKIRRKSYAYDRAIEGIRNCKENNILVTVSTTTMQSNKNDLENIVINSINSGAGIIGFQSYVPDQKLGENDPEFIGAKETYKIYKKIRELDKKYGNEIKILQTEVLWQMMQIDTKIKRAARREKKFLSGCSIGFSGLSVLSDGTVYPCRRLPIPIGNIKEGIRNLILNKGIMKELRDFNTLQKNNENCEHVYYCRGCRAIAYATTGNYLSKDPMCFKELVKPKDLKPRKGSMEKELIDKILSS